MFGEIQWHRNSGATWPLELVTFSSDANHPLFDNSLSGMYWLSGSETLFFKPGDTISYFTRLTVEPENLAAGSLYLGIQDTVLFFVELYDLTNGNILDTLGHWGAAPSDTLGQVHWMVSDTTIMKRYVVPDFQLGSSTLLQLKVRPAFKGNNDRLSISRWDVFTTERLSQEMVLAKSVYLAWADTVLSKMAAAEAGGVGALTIEMDADGSFARVRLPDNVNAANIQVYDLLGKVCLSRQIEGQSHGDLALPLSGLSSGVYIVVASAAGNKVVGVAKLEVRK